MVVINAIVLSNNCHSCTTSACSVVATGRASLISSIIFCNLVGQPAEEPSGLEFLCYVVIVALQAGFVGFLVLVVVVVVSVVAAVGLVVVAVNWLLLLSMSDCCLRYLLCSLISTTGSC